MNQIYYNRSTCRLCESNNLTETLKLEPRHFGALDGMVLIFLHQKKYEKAIQIYEEILKIFPKSKTTLNKKQKLLDYISKST